MKVMAIQPAALDYDGQVVSSRSARFDDLTLAYLAALSPPDVEFVPVVEKIDAVDFDADVDLVAITSMGVSPMQRAYDISRRFRARGVAVVMGGPNFSLVPQEAKANADAVVVGEVEPVWSKVLADSRNGTLAPFYEGPTLDNLAGLPVPRYDLFNTRPEFKGAFFTVQASRGCPHKCEFCAIGSLHKGTIRYRPIDDVIRDVKATGVKRIFFADDNMMANPKYFTELFRRLIPLKIHWLGASTIMIGGQPEMLKLAKKSGCLLLVIGVESISQENLNMVDKKFNRVKEYETLLGAIQSAGIVAACTTIFGFDEDTPEVFDRTVEFYMRNRIKVAPLFTLTPVPGTVLWRKLKDAGRLLTDDYRRYDAVKAVYQPAKMTVRELEEGIVGAYQKLYGAPAIAHRLFPPLRSAASMGVAMLMNLKYNRLARHGGLSVFNFS